MYCMYCGEKLIHHEKILDNLFECKYCGISFEIYPKTSPNDEEYLEIIEDLYPIITEDGMEESRYS